MTTALRVSEKSACHYHRGYVMPRLFVRKITSVGVVAEGDNPEATIMLWKSAPDTPAEPKPPVAVRVAKVLNRQARQIAAVGTLARGW